MKIKLFCICGAGASAVAFLKWQKKLDSRFELCLVELPGRGLREDEKVIYDLKELVDDLYLKYIEPLNNEDYMIFGTCFGAIAAYCLYQKIQDKKVNQPSHIFFATSSPPYGKQYWIPLLEDITYKQEAVSLFTTFFPSSYFSDETSFHKFIEIFTDNYYQSGKNLEKEKLYPYIDREDITEEEKEKVVEFGRNMAVLFQIDCKMLQEYQSQNIEFPEVRTDMTVLAADKDVMVSLEEANEWKKYARGKYDFKVIHGTHMFFNDNYEDVLEVVNGVLE